MGELRGDSSFVFSFGSASVQSSLLTYFNIFFTQKKKEQKRGIKVPKYGLLLQVGIQSNTNFNSIQSVVFFSGFNLSYWSNLPIHNQSNSIPNPIR